MNKIQFDTLDYGVSGTTVFFWALGHIFFAFRNLIILGRYRSCCDAKTNDGRYEVENWCDELAKRVRKRDQYRTIVAVQEKGRCFAA